MTDVLQDAPFEKNGFSTFRESNHRDSKTRALTYVLEIQDVLRKDATNQKLKARDRAASARVWREFEEVRHVLTGFGRPKSVEAANSPSSRKHKPKSTGMIDPDEMKVSKDVTPVEKTTVTPAADSAESPTFIG